MATHTVTEKPTMPNVHATGIHDSESQQRKECQSFLIIGAGSRGNAYATALTQSASNIQARIGAIAEPITSKRNAFEQKYVREHETCQLFGAWQAFVEFEKDRQKREVQGERTDGAIDGVFVCTLDEMHVEIITALAPLGLNIMSEKPLATTLSDCLSIYRSLQPPGTASPRAVFSVGHVLRYSPHNIMLRKLLLEDGVIGDVLSIEHTEPVGWWHFSHSYVRGNWRKESTTAPSLLTKSCHDIDLLLWLLCSPSTDVRDTCHVPSLVTSTGSLLYFKRNRKPALAGDATNCLSCPAETECLYSAKKIYLEGQLDQGNAAWPINIIDPEIEDLVKSQKGSDIDDARQRLLERLSEDFDESTPQREVDQRPWFGRCVYESGNDVCDDQVVTMIWEDAPLPPTPGANMENRLRGRGAKIATFHMVASTEKQCERRGMIYGTKGEIEYDSKVIRVYDFETRAAQTHQAHQPGGGHGGGDAGLAWQFVKAIQAVQMQSMNVAEAQKQFIGCTLEEIIRSHAMVFAAEEARKERKVVNWADWWRSNVEEAVDEGVARSSALQG